jgi:hypothetical protein
MGLALCWQIGILGAKQKRKIIQRIQIVFAFAAHVAEPGGKIRDSDHPATQKGEIGHRCLVHLTNTAVTARDHAKRVMKMPQLIHALFFNENYYNRILSMIIRSVISKIWENNKEE